LRRWFGRFLKRWAASAAARRWQASLAVEQLGDRVVPAFLAAIPYAVPGGAAVAAVGDFNGDGTADIASAAVNLAAPPASSCPPRPRPLRERPCR
jgi:hypothetical protein